MTTIELTCPGCQKQLRVPRYVPGKMVRCPYCQGTHMPSNDKPDDPELLVLDESNTALAADDSWQMKTPEGQIYGPASKADFDEWLREGRITGDCLILRPGHTAWQWATAVYPQLAAVPTGPAARYAPPTYAPPNPYASPGMTYGAALATAYLPRTPKSRMTAILLAIPPLCFLGLHRFYLGYSNTGLIQLLFLFFFPCVSLIWGLIDFISLLTGALDRDQDGWPLA